MHHLIGIQTINHIACISLLCLFLLSGCRTESAIAGLLPTPINQLSASKFKKAQVLFESNCQVCHETVDTGPPFKNYLPTFTKITDGRSYIINVTLYGLDGEITALGKPYNSLMANYTTLSDEEIALILNYGLTAWENNSLLPENFTLISSAEVVKERKVTKSIEQILALRNALELP